MAEKKRETENTPLHMCDGEYLRCYGLRRWLVTLPTTLPRDQFPKSKSGYVRFLLAHEILGGTGKPDSPVDFDHVNGALDFIAEEVVAPGWAKWTEGKDGWELCTTDQGEDAVIGANPPEAVDYDLDEAVDCVLWILGTALEDDDGEYDPRFHNGFLSAEELGLWMQHCGVGADVGGKACDHAFSEGWIHGGGDKRNKDRVALSDSGWHRLQERYGSETMQPIDKSTLAARRISDLIDALEEVGRTVSALGVAAFKVISAEPEKMDPEIHVHALATNHEFAERLNAPIEREVREADAALCDALEQTDNIAWCLESEFGEQSRPTETAIRYTLQRLAECVPHMLETALVAFKGFKETMSDLKSHVDLLNSLSYPTEAELPDVVVDSGRVTALQIAVDSDKQTPPAPVQSPPPTVPPAKGEVDAGQPDKPPAVRKAPPKKRGRRPKSGVADRDRAIVAEHKKHPGNSHAQIAETVAPDFKDVKCGVEQVRKAIANAKNGGKKPFAI